MLRSDLGCPGDAAGCQVGVRCGHAARGWLMLGLSTSLFHLHSMSVGPVLAGSWLASLGQPRDPEAREVVERWLGKS